MTARKGELPSTFRTDVQGLRALAVLVVFADHMLGWPSGGFLGVDVFFVISGFLITGLLLREYERTGHISFRSFYIGRLKRIVPAATTVLLFVIAFSFALFASQRAITISWDAFWAFLFAANWNFAAAGTDYFQQSASVSPLQHYWSLSVEEQFYFVWPWLLLGLLVVFAKFFSVTGRRARAIAGITIAIISAVSFGWAMHQSAIDPTVAYFSTLTRGWELGIGAFVAVASPVFSKIPSLLRTLLAYAGLLAIIGSCVVISSESHWPAPWALLPTVATALVLISGIGEQARYIWPLTNRVSVFIGDISYSLYLWHFPVIIFAHALYPDAGVAVYFGIAVVGFLLAVAQYFAIERPIWKSPLWVKSRSPRWRSWWSDYGDQIKQGSLVGLATLTVAVVATAFIPTAPPIDSPADRASSPMASSTTPAARTAVEIAEDAVSAALGTSVWPELTPTVDQLGDSSKATAWGVDHCLAYDAGTQGETGQDTADRCTYGDPDGAQRMVLLGDSIAISWLPSLISTFGDKGWRIDVLTMMQCPYSQVDVRRGDGRELQACMDYQDWALGRIQEIRPNLLIASQADSTLGRLVSDAQGGVGESEMVQGTLAFLESASPISERVVLLGAPPQGQDMQSCYLRTSAPDACIRKPFEDHQSMLRVLETSVEQAEKSNVSLVVPDSLFCSSGVCPSFSDGIIMMADGRHLTQAYAVHIAPAVFELISSVDE